MVKIGLVGKPNVGKSTIFSAMTRTAVGIANYPFTTLKPNMGMAFISMECPEGEINSKCNPREGYCENGIRHIPVEILDVPGLIPGASQGKGMGNEFLDNVRDSEALCHIVDASGMTGLDGSQAAEWRDPLLDLEAIENELISWLSDRIYRDWDKFARKADSSGEKLERSLAGKLASFGIREKQVSMVISEGAFPARLGLWSTQDAHDFAALVFNSVKPIFRIFNKSDRVYPEARASFKTSGPGYIVSGEFELALEKAKESALIDRVGTDFSIIGNLTSAQRSALDTIRNFFSDPSVTRITDILGKIVLKDLAYVIVYPVVDESTWEDNKGNVLPDAFLMPAGSTALDLAYKVHTEIGEGFIRAIDCRTRMAIGKDHVNKNSDVIRIVSKTRYPLRTRSLQISRYLQHTSNQAGLPA